MAEFGSLRGMNQRSERKKLQEGEASDGHNGVAHQVTRLGRPAIDHLRIPARKRP